MTDTINIEAIEADALEVDANDVALTDAEIAKAFETETEVAQVETAKAEAPKAKTAKADTAKPETIKVGEEILKKIESAVDSAAFDWVLVRTYAKRERSVKVNIENRLEILNLHEYVPEILVLEENFIDVTDGVKVKKTRVRMPGYLLVNMDIYNDELVAEIRRVNGVVNYAGGYEPVPLRRSEVMQILTPIVTKAPDTKAKTDETSAEKSIGQKSSGISVEVNFVLGEIVTVIEGPFEGMDATISEIDVEHERIQGLISIFGRETPVDLHLNQIKKQD